MQSRLLDRTLIYTALTRGIEQVVFVGDRESFDAAIVSPPRFHERNVGFWGADRVAASTHHQLVAA